MCAYPAPAAVRVPKQRAAPAFVGGCPFVLDVGKTCNRERRQIATDEEKYCRRHASQVDRDANVGQLQLRFCGGCPFVLGGTEGEICNKKRQQIASDGEKYCRPHASFVDRLASGTGCPYIVDDTANKCGLPLRSLPASDGVFYCAHHMGVIDGIGPDRLCPDCFEEGIQQRIQTMVWCRGFCRHHATCRGYDPYSFLLKNHAMQLSPPRHCI